MAAAVNRQLRDQGNEGFVASAPGPQAFNLCEGELLIEAGHLTVVAPDCQAPDATGHLQLLLTWRKERQSPVRRYTHELPLWLPGGRVRLSLDKLPPWLEAVGPKEATKALKRGATVSWSVKLRLCQDYLYEALTDNWPAILTVGLYRGVRFKLGEVHVKLLAWAKSLCPRPASMACEKAGKTFPLTGTPVPSHVLGPGWSQAAVPSGLARLTGLPDLGHVQYTAYVYTPGNLAPSPPEPIPDRPALSLRSVEVTQEPVQGPVVEPVWEKAGADTAMEKPSTEMHLKVKVDPEFDPYTNSEPNTGPHPDVKPDKEPSTPVPPLSSRYPLEIPKTPPPPEERRSGVSQVGPVATPPRPATGNHGGVDKPGWVADLIETLSGGVQPGKAKQMKLPINIATYNVGAIKDVARVKEVLLVLLGPFDRSLAGAGGALSLFRPDVICLQGLQGSTASRAKNLLIPMANRGFDHVWEGQLVILWSRATLVRVAEARSFPDFTWSHEHLRDAWAPDSPLDQQYRQDRADMDESDANTFFRVPPITVVLRRPLTESIYVITNAHLPATEKPYQLAQLARSARWLLGADSYGQVVEHLARRRGVDQHLSWAASGLPARRGLMAPECSNVAHIVVGDFSAHMYDSARAQLLQEGASRDGRKGSTGGDSRGSSGSSGRSGGGCGGPPFPFLMDWTAIQACETSQGEPGTADHRGGDMMYVMREPAVRLGLTVTLAERRNSASRADGGAGAGAAYQPLIVSLREGQQPQQEAPTLQAAESARMHQVVERMQGLLKGAVQEGTADVGRLLEALQVASNRLKSKTA